MGWTPVVRRKESARSEESDSSGNLNVIMDLNKGRILGVEHGGRDSWNLSETFASFKTGGSDTQPYFFEN